MDSLLHEFSWISLPRWQSQFVFLFFGSRSQTIDIQFFAYLMISTQPSFMMWVVLCFIRWEEREESLSNNWGWRDQLFHCPKCTGSRQWVDGDKGFEGNATEDSDLLHKMKWLNYPCPTHSQSRSLQYAETSVLFNIRILFSGLWNMLECYHLPRHNAISFDPIVARSHIFVDSFGSLSPLPFYWEIDFTMVNQFSYRRCGKNTSILDIDIQQHK